MSTANKSTQRKQMPKPALPLVQGAPIIHGDIPTVQHWLQHYWHKLQLPAVELNLLAITQDRQEYMLWTGKRLNTMALGCYCYVSSHGTAGRKHISAERISQILHRHLIFIEPVMLPKSIEVTIAHELIHLADRVNGTPRRHHHHGYDSIADDEAAITGYQLEDLRLLLHEESMRRESIRRQLRPIRYLYQCPNCSKTYPRTRRYSQSVSCSSCDKHYNPRFKLLISPIPVNEDLLSGNSTINNSATH